MRINRPVSNGDAGSIGTTFWSNRHPIEKWTKFRALTSDIGSGRLTSSIPSKPAKSQALYESPTNHPERPHSRSRTLRADRKVCRKHIGWPRLFETSSALAPSFSPLRTR